MNTAAEILSLFDSLGVTIRINERGDLAVRPADRVTPDMARRVKAVEPDMRRLLLERDAEMRKPPSAHEPNSGLIEAYFRPTVELVWPQPRDKVVPADPKFPACPDCHVARYWISHTGKVVCGKCGQVRFILAAIEYHPVN